MNFSSDRDLLALEPNVFQDVPFVAQQRLRVDDGVLAGTSLTSVSADFEAVGVEAGGVALIDRVPYEVISRDDAQSLTVSKLRARLSDSALPGTEGMDVEVIVRSFEPQAALVHDGLLRMLGIDADDPEASLSEDAVVSLSVMARLEALGTLERIYSGAMALGGSNEVVQTKAREYGRRFHLAGAQATVLIDTDGDGYANERRHLGLLRMTRV